MKILLTWLIILTSCAQVSAQQPIVQFRISKPLCVYMFLKTMVHSNGTSPTFYDHIKTHTQPTDNVMLNKLVTDFAAIDFGNSDHNAKYPAKRMRPDNMDILLHKAIAQSEDVGQMKIINGLSETEWVKLVAILKQAEPYYDKIVWNDCKEAIYSQLMQLEKNAKSFNEVFIKTKTFYGSSWQSDKPFIVYIYPMPPAKRGISSATPYGDILVLNMFTNEKDYHDRLSVAAHEMSHVLYMEQPPSLQFDLDSAYNQSTSAYAAMAYNYIDEALATACGNAWAYHTLSGKPDTGSWYNDEIINGYAHAIYPLVEEYINKGKCIDKAFINASISLYEKTFPDAIFRYSNLLMSNHLYTDAENNTEYHTITNTLTRYFSVSSFYGNYPLLDPRSLQGAETSDGTQLFIIHTNNKANLDGLKALFPELKNADPNKEMIAGFMDKNKRAIIIINVMGIPRLTPALELMVKEKLMTKDMFTMLN